MQQYLILLDIYLPDITGIDLLPTIKILSPHSEVIIMTAYKEIQIAITSLRNGAADYINKPFLKVDLLTTISKTLQKKYIQTVIPEIRKDLIKSLPASKRINLLNERQTLLKHQNKLLSMGEIYEYFPELKASNIAEDFLLPNQLTDQGIDQFIEKMKENIFPTAPTK